MLKWALVHKRGLPTNKMGNYWEQKQVKNRSKTDCGILKNRSNFL